MTFLATLKFALTFGATIGILLKAKCYKHGYLEHELQLMYTQFLVYSTVSVNLVEMFFLSKFLSDFDNQWSGIRSKITIDKLLFCLLIWPVFAVERSANGILPLKMTVLLMLLIMFLVALQTSPSYNLYHVQMHIHDLKRYEDIIQEDRSVNCLVDFLSRVKTNLAPFQVPNDNAYDGEWLLDSTKLCICKPLSNVSMFHKETIFIGEAQLFAICLFKLLTCCVKDFSGKFDPKLLFRVVIPISVALIILAFTDQMRGHLATPRAHARLAYPVLQIFGSSFLILIA
jgi:hypothetical protein